MAYTKTDNTTIMKKSLLIAAGAALASIAVSVFVYVNNGKNGADEFFNANVEALADGEGTIIVGDLCMVCANAACTSLGEVFKDRIKPY